MVRNRTGDKKGTSYDDLEVKNESNFSAELLLSFIYGRFVFPVEGYADVPVVSGTREYDLSKLEGGGFLNSNITDDPPTDPPGLWPFVHLLKVERTDLDSAHPVPCHFPKMGSYRRVGYSRSFWPPSVSSSNRSPALYLRGNRFLGFHTPPTTSMTLRVYTAPALEWSLSSTLGPEQIPVQYHPLIALYTARAFLGGEDSGVSAALEIEISRRELHMDETIRPLKAAFSLSMAR